MDTQYDIVIIGAGLVGLTALIALSPLNLKIALVDGRHPLEVPDIPETRSIALSWKSVKILESYGLKIQEESESSLIKHIHISEKGSAAIARLEAHEMGLPFLGVVSPIQSLLKKLIEAAKNLKVDWIFPHRVMGVDTESGRVDFNDHPSLQAKIVLVADGAESSLRRQLGIVEERVDYHQTAVVTSVTLNRPHEEWAFERFCQDRTLALLPLSSQRAAVILSLSNQESEKVISFNELEFIEYLQNEFGYRLGRFLTRGPMHHYPLYQVLAQESHRGRFLLIGSAAHHLSPVAAQGFNLSLRDVDTFRSLMSLNAFSPDIFDRYDIARQKDQSQVVSVTHRISTLFGDTRLSIQVARKLGISMFERSLLAKRYFVDLIMGDEGD